MKRLLADELASLMTASTHDGEARCESAGAWRVAARHAITLQPHTGGVFHVVRGAFWATFDGPHEVAARNCGDHFLCTGDSLHVRAGERLVIEPWYREQCAYFGWEADCKARRRIAGPATVPLLKAGLQLLQEAARRLFRS